MIHADDYVHGLALTEELGLGYDPAYDKVISRTDDSGKLLGGFLFKDFTGASIVAHMAGFAPRWMSRQLIWMAFHYPFEQLGVRQILGPVPASNSRALEINARLGFKEVARVADVYEDGDLILMTITRAQCRWLNKRPGQEQSRG